jgi:hypothetical protein
MFFLAFQAALPTGCVLPAISGDYYYKISCTKRDKRQKITYLELTGHKYLKIISLKIRH